MNRVALVLAAATVTGVGIAATNAAVNTPTTAPAPSQVISSSANKAISAQPAVSADVQIHGLFADLTNYALSPKHMDHLVALLDQSSRHRIAHSSTYSENYGKTLDAQIEQVASTWKQKYGHDFSTKTAGHDFGTAFASIQSGTASKDAKLATDVMNASGQKATNSLRFRGDESVALVDVKGAHGLADLRIPLACKSGGSWRLIAPSSLTAEKLRANLAAEFAAMTAPHAQWPATESDAYREVTHRVLMAVLDQPAPAQKQAAAKTNSAMTGQQASAQPVQSTVKPASMTSSSNTGHWWQFWRW